MRSGSEEHWIRRSDDLASIARDGENGWLNAVVEDGIGLVSRSLLLVSGYFLPPERPYSGYEFLLTLRYLLHVLQPRQELRW